MEDIMVPKYHNYTIYAHNGGNFDFNFIFKLIFNNFNSVTKILSRENSLLTFSVKHKIGKNNVKVVFNDSYSLLPFSLDYLGKSFEVNTKKGIFPYNFVTKDTINYIGNAPSLNYYIDNEENRLDITLQYQNYIQHHNLNNN